MKKILGVVFVLCVGFMGELANGDEWVSYMGPNAYGVIPAQPNILYYPVFVVPQYVPVVIYQNVVVETRCWHLLKKTEIVAVPRTVYVPVIPPYYRY